MDADGLMVSRDGLRRMITVAPDEPGMVTITPERIEAAAKAAYEAQVEHTRPVFGDRHWPDWADVREHHKEGWRATVRAALKAALEPALLLSVRPGASPRGRQEGGPERRGAHGNDQEQARHVGGRGFGPLAADPHDVRAVVPGLPRAEVRGQPDNHDSHLVLVDE